MIKTGKELAAACLDVAKNHKTLYVMGCFGAPMTAANKERYTTNHSYNKKAARTRMIQAASADTFGFDCVNLIKGLLWGWSGDKSQTYGGAKYASNGVPDTNADGMIKLCKDVSTDFSKLQIGEALWLKGHIGIYIGDGQAVECTPAWKNCVQVTTVKNIKSGTGHKWTKHGKLPWISYEEDAAQKPTEEATEPAQSAAKPVTTYYSVRLPLLQKGSEGDSVKAMQILLKGYGYDLGKDGPNKDGIDGEFGPLTENAVESFQEDNQDSEGQDLEVDGKWGPKCWGAALGL